MSQPSLFPAVEDCPPRWCFVCQQHRTQPRPEACDITCVGKEQQ